MKEELSEIQRKTNLETVEMSRSVKGSQSSPSPMEASPPVSVGSGSSSSPSLMDASPPVSVRSGVSSSPSPLSYTPSSIRSTPTQMPSPMSNTPSSIHSTPPSVASPPPPPATYSHTAAATFLSTETQADGQKMFSVICTCGLRHNLLVRDGEVFARF